MNILHATKLLDSKLRHYDWYYCAGSDVKSTIFIYTKKRLAKEYNIPEIKEFEEEFTIRITYMGKVIPG